MFRTELKPATPDFQIDLKTKMLSMGSCFANEMGQKMQEHKFNISTNPGGILFNPLSIFRLLKMALNQQPLPGWSFANRQGMQVNYLLHSDMAAKDEQTLHQSFQQLSTRLNKEATNADLVIFTFGTAFVYEFKENGEIVANCHKVPQKHFEKRMLSVEEIMAGFESVKAQIEALNPNVKFMLTVSPVRHIKEGLPENNVSKSTLRLACHQLVEAFDNVDYFPAYELMMDDLRDYRFYEKDLIHPNEQAREYIWERFGESWFNEATRLFVHDWSKVRSALDHKAFHAESAAHQAFLRSLLNKLENFSKQVDVAEEVAYVKGQLKPA